MFHSGATEALATPSSEVSTPVQSGQSMAQYQTGLKIFTPAQPYASHVTEYD